MNFEDLGLPRQYLNAIEDLGFEQATQIQQKAIPPIRSGQHVIGIAQTGTGKTAAYLLPILQTISYPQGTAPRCIIIVPTKELVLQVVEQINQLATYTEIRFTGLYGGVGRKKQAASYQSGIDIIVSTPRRLLEMYEEEQLQLNKVEILVLDEADRMLDMGFLPQINLLLDILPRKKQNLLFSATFSPKVEELSWNFMDFPLKIEITPEATPVETVQQIRYNTPNFQTKLNIITHLLEDEEAFHRVICFAKTKKTATKLYDYLRKKATGTIRVIHSNKDQNARINAFNDFKQGDVRLLIATDVMARGIDIPQVSHVINVDVPVVYEDYVHRIGRTGRAFNTGCAITFVLDSDVYHINMIEKKIRMAIPTHDIPEGVEIPETPFEEQQAIAREIDNQRKKEDPNFKGAFHEKQHPAARKRKSPKFGKGGKFKVAPKGGRRKTSKKNRHKK